jgi:hypothetical protein
MSYNKQKLCESFKSIYKNTFEDFDESNGYRRLKILGGAGTQIQFGDFFKGRIQDDASKTMYIIDDGVDALDQFVEELLKDDEFKECVSREGVEKEVTSVLKNYYEEVDLDDLHGLISEKIIKSIRREITERIVYVKVSNLKIDREIELGDVSFVTDIEAKKAVNHFNNQRRLKSKFRTEEQIENAKQFKEVVEQITNSSPAFVKVKCKSHFSNIDRVAISEALVWINCIRAFSHVVSPPSDKAFWGLPEEVPDSISSFISLDHDEDKSGINIQSKISGKVQQFILGPKFDFCTFFGSIALSI